MFELLPSLSMTPSCFLHPLFQMVGVSLKILHQSPIRIKSKEIFLGKDVY
jgi:hypothetical protein